MNCRASGWPAWVRVVCPITQAGCPFICLCDDVLLSWHAVVAMWFTEESRIV